MDPHVPLWRDPEEEVERLFTCRETNGRHTGKIVSNNTERLCV